MQAQYDTAKLVSPELIPGYKTVETLVSGHTGQLYSAVELETGTACKLLVREADLESGERFIAEANIAATLFEPSIEDIYESGRLDDGRVFVVSEYITGRSLRLILDTDGIPPLLVTVEIIRRAAEALHHLHARGLAHRAIRPDNIIVTNDDGGMLVRLQHLDLAGLAQRSIVGNKFSIQTGIASLRYYSPEQTTNEDASPSTDIYSLGIVFYELLTGSPPFDAAKAATLIGMHRNEMPAEVRIDDFDLRMLVTHALRESLQKRPEARQSTADLFARQLRQIEQLATHVSTPPPIMELPTAEERLAPRKVVAPVEYLPEVVTFGVEPTPHPQIEEPEPIVNANDPIDIADFQQQIDMAAIPRKIGFTTVEDDIPTLDDVVALFADKVTVGPVTEPVEPVEWTAYEFEASPGQIHSENFVNEFETEEITIVKAPTRLVVDLSKPVKTVPAFQTYERFSERQPSDVDFFPTLLGDMKKNTYAQPVAKDSLFSSYDTPRRNILSLRSRIGIASGGLVALVAFFLFGSNLMKRLVETSSSDDSVVAASATNVESVPKERKPIVTSSAPKFVSDSVTAPKTQTSAKASTEVPAAKSVSSEPRVVQSSVKNQVGAKASMTPTTLVISAEKGRIKMKSEPTKPQAGTTRPRIVKEPK